MIYTVRIWPAVPPVLAVTYTALLMALYNYSAWEATLAMRPCDCGNLPYGEG